MLRCWSWARLVKYIQPLRRSVLCHADALEVHAWLPFAAGSFSRAAVWMRPFAAEAATAAATAAKPAGCADEEAKAKTEAEAAGCADEGGIWPGEVAWQLQDCRQGGGSQRGDVLEACRAPRGVATAADKSVLCGLGNTAALQWPCDTQRHRRRLRQVPAIVVGLRCHARINRCQPGRGRPPRQRVRLLRCRTARVVVRPKGHGPTRVRFDRLDAAAGAAGAASGAAGMGSGQDKLCVDIP